jgi:hypothetical protein
MLLILTVRKCDIHWLAINSCLISKVTGSYVNYIVCRGSSLVCNSSVIINCFDFKLPIMKLLNNYRKISCVRCKIFEPR